MAPAQALRQADAAIVGQLVKVVPLGAGRAEFRYRVRGVYKGTAAIEPGTTISVRGTSQSAACGLPQATGRRYGLLLGEYEGRWVGGLCGLIEPRKLRYAAGQGGSPRRAPEPSGGAGHDCAI